MEQSRKEKGDEIQMITQTLYCHHFNLGIKILMMNWKIPCLNKLIYQSTKERKNVLFSDNLSQEGKERNGEIGKI